MAAPLRTLGQFVDPEPPLFDVWPRSERDALAGLSAHLCESSSSGPGHSPPELVHPIREQIGPLPTATSVRRALIKSSSAAFHAAAGRSQTNQATSDLGFAIGLLVLSWADSSVQRGSQYGHVAHGSVMPSTRGAASRTHAHGAVSASNHKGAGRNSVGVTPRQVEAPRRALMTAPACHWSGCLPRRTSIQWVIQTTCP